MKKQIFAVIALAVVFVVGLLAGGTQPVVDAQTKGGCPARAQYVDITVKPLQTAVDEFVFGSGCPDLRVTYQGGTVYRVNGIGSD